MALTLQLSFSYALSSSVSPKVWALFIGAAPVPVGKVEAGSAGTQRRMLPSSPAEASMSPAGACYHRVSEQDFPTFCTSHASDAKQVRRRNDRARARARTFGGPPDAVDDALVLAEGREVLDARVGVGVGRCFRSRGLWSRRRRGGRGGRGGKGE